MAKEQIIGLRVNIKGTKETVDRVAQIATELDKVTAELKDLEKAKKKPFDTAELAKFNQKIAELKAQQAALRVEQKAANKELNLQAQAFAAVGNAAGSYDAIDAKLKLLRRQFKGLSDEARASDFGQSLQGEINILDNQLKVLDANIGVFTRNVGNYEQSLINALKRAGNEKALSGRLSELTNQTERLQQESKQLTDILTNPNAYGAEQTKEAIKELQRLEKQIQANEKEAKQLQSALDAGADENKKNKPSGRAVRRAGKLAGLGGLADLAGGAVDLQNVLGGLGPAGVAAFGVFAAGGLVFKGVQALEQLTAGINKTTAEVQRLSGASATDAKELTDQVRGLSIAFGESEEAILDQTKQLQEGLGIGFAEALDKVKNGYIATAQAGGALDSTINNQLESAGKLAAVQRELADRFNDTGISTGKLVTDIKTGLLTALIAVFDTIKPLVDGFISFGKTLFNIGGVVNKVTGGAGSFGKVLRVLAVPVKIVGTLISKAATILGNLVAKVVEFINESPTLQAAFKFIGDAAESFVSFIEKIPEALVGAIDAVGNFLRDAGSFTTGGLIDDAATAQASADARNAGETISAELVKRYGEGLKAVSTETQFAIAQAGANAAFEAVLAGKGIAEAIAEGLRASDRVARQNNLIVQKQQKELSEAQLQSQLEAAEKAKAAREKAAAEQLKQIEDLQKRQEETRKDFDKTLEEAQKQRAEESISFIKNDYQRQTAEIEAQAAAQVEAVSQTLTEANEAAQEVLSQKAQLLAKNPNLAKSLGFASVNEIQAAASQQQQATDAEIAAQTAQIERKRVEQLAILKKNREQLIGETLRNIDNEALARSIDQQDLQQQISDNEIAARRKAAEVRIQDAEAEYQRISGILAIQRDANLLTEKEYNARVGELDRSLSIAKLDIQRQTQAEIAALEREALDQQLVTLQLRADQEQRAAEERRAQSIANIQAQAGQGVLTEQQAAAEIAQINADAEDQKVAKAQLRAQEIEAINTEFANKQLTQAQSEAAQELEIQRQLQAAIRAERQATFDQLNQNLQNLNSAFATVTQISEDLFTASSNRRTQAIETQYNKEVELANGNQALITAAEERKDKELAAIEKVAFERKKRLDTAQALINGALAITNILATTPDPTGIFTAIRIAGAVAATAAQVVKIQSQQFALGGLIESGGKMPKNGGLIKGKRHSNGGVKFMAGGALMEAEGGEAIMTSGAVQKFGGLLSILNQAGGGAAFERGGIVSTTSSPYKYQLGGIAPVSVQSIQSQQQQANQMSIMENILAVANNNIRTAISRIKVINDPKETIQEGAKQITQSTQNSL